MEALIAEVPPMNDPVSEQIDYVACEVSTGAINGLELVAA